MSTAVAVTVFVVAYALIATEKSTGSWSPSPGPA